MAEKKDKSFYDAQEEKLRHALLYEYDLFNFERLKEEYILSLDPIIKKYAARYVQKGTGLLEFNDFVNEAYVRVYEKFDEFKFKTRPDIKLATFLTWHIVDAMQALKSHNEQAYKCSTSSVKILPKIKKFMLENQNMSIDEVAAHFKTSRSRLLSILDSEKRSESTFKTISDDGKNVLLDTFQSNQMNSEDKFLLNKTKKELKEILDSTLKERENIVIEKFFGLGTEEPKNLVAISKEIDCSKERVRQIKEEALERIRTSNKAKYIIELLTKIIKIQNVTA